MAKPAEEKELVRALTRGLDVILAFSRHRPRMSLTEVADAVGLSRPTARRLLLTLQAAGYVSTDGRTFALTPQVLALGYAYLSSLDLTETAQPYMEGVVEHTGEGCSLSTLDDTEVVYVTRVPTHRVTSITLATGTRLPAHATSMGHVLLADLGPQELDRYLARTDFHQLTARTISTERDLRARLETVRGKGWAMVDQELEPGLRSISAPVRDTHDRVIAAMSLSSMTATTDESKLLDQFLPVLLRAAHNTSTQLGSNIGD